MADILQRVRDAVMGVLPNITDDIDFFHRGLDSMGVALIFGGLIDLGCNSEMIYRFPTINTLTARLNGGDDEIQPTQENTIAGLLDKYSSFPKYDADNDTPVNANPRRRVLVTGATGSLGSHIVAVLVADESVDQVFCLVRPNPQLDPHRRVMDALRDRQLLHAADGTTTADQQRQLRKIVAYSSDLACDNCTHRSNLTDVIHCAWTMNYRMQLKSFEHLIHGTYNLISDCLNQRPPPAFHFASSIAATPISPIVESLLDTPAPLAGATGYSQSKYVVERLCANAVASCADLKVCILRLGYLVGNRANGQWSKTEEHPLVVRSLEMVPRLPSRPNYQLSLLPVDDAANACVQLMFTTRAGVGNPRVFNVANPALIAWDGVFLAGTRAAFESPVRTVLSSQWVTNLQTAAPDYPLLGYFQEAYGDDDAAIEILTTEARRCSPHLAACQAIDAAVMKRFVQGWNILREADPEDIPQ